MKNGDSSVMLGAACNAKAQSGCAMLGLCIIGFLMYAAIRSLVKFEVNSVKAFLCVVQKSQSSRYNCESLLLTDKHHEQRFVRQWY